MDEHQLVEILSSMKNQPNSLTIVIHRNVRIGRYLALKITKILFRHAVSAIAIVRFTQSHGDSTMLEESYLLIGAFP